MAKIRKRSNGPGRTRKTRETTPPVTETIRKEWPNGPLDIEVTDHWRFALAGSTHERYCSHADDYNDLIRQLHPTKDHPLISIATYETRVAGKGSTGVYFNHCIAQLDAEDHDLSRNLNAMYLQA